MLKKIQLVLPTTFLALGLFVAFVSFKGLFYSYQASSWETAYGQIEDIKFSHERGYKGANTSARDIKYLYKVKGKKFTGNKEFFGFKISTNNQTNGGYSKGMQVKVFYNPANPKMSVLKPKSRRAIWLGLVVGFVFGSFGGFGIYKTLYSNKHH